MNPKKDIKDELKDIAPFLSKMDKKSGFKVPHNYFEQLPDDIMKQLEPKQKPQAASFVSWWEQSVQLLLAIFQPRAVMALASIALVMGSFFYLNRGKDHVNNKLDADQYFAYINQNIDEFDEEIILELSLNEDIDLEILSNSSIDEQELDNFIEEVIDDLDDSSIEDLL